MSRGRGCTPENMRANTPLSRAEADEVTMDEFRTLRGWPWGLH